MNKPKRYKLDELYNTTMLGCEDFFYADDPAIVSALKDSEDLATIKDLVGAHSINDILQWKRSHEAMEKLERIARKQSEDGYAISLAHIMRRIEIAIVPIPWQKISEAPSLIEAIEQMKE